MSKGKAESMTIVTAFKVMRLRKDGTLGPLFINASDRYQVGEWYERKEGTHVKGFAYRPGFHAVRDLDGAPHLMADLPGRVWVKVEIAGITTYDRPISQGGKWYLAEKMRIVEVLG